jgi:hypothetical protein
MWDCAWGRATEREMREQDNTSTFVRVSIGVANVALSELPDKLQPVYEFESTQRSSVV